MSTIFDQSKGLLELKFEYENKQKQTFISPMFIVHFVR